MGVLPMTTKCLLRKRKAVSTVVAAVLLIAITVVAVAVVWTIVLPMLTPKAQIDIIQVTWEDRDGDNLADKVVITIQNKGSKSISIDTTKGLQAYYLDGDPHTGFDFTIGNSDTWGLEDSTARRGVHSTEPVPSSYPSLDAGQQVTITIYLRLDSYGDRFSWNDGDRVQIKIFLDDGSTYVEQFTVDI